MELESYRIAKDSELENDNKQSKQGLNIGNLVNSYRYSNALLNEKIKMFVRYLKVFHNGSINASFKPWHSMFSMTSDAIPTHTFSNMIWNFLKTNDLAK